MEIFPKTKRKCVGNTISLGTLLLLSACELPLPDYRAEAAVIEDYAIAQSKEANLEKEKRPALIVSGTPDMSVALLVNPFHCPLHITFDEPILEGDTNEITIDANSTERLPLKPPSPSQFRYEWEFGAINIDPDNYGYWPPFTGKQQPISQSFGGKFSHQDKYNYYAVDIALPSGTTIVAARSGTVIEVIDSYRQGGLNADFKAKANNITILHSDGSFADYSHLRHESAAVSVGDYINKGQILAQSGATGYVNGPHLHFGIWKNTGTERQSLAFEFEMDGERFKPVDFLWLKPQPTLVEEAP